MENNERIVTGEVGDAVVGAPIPPAPAADDQKAIPAAADETTAEPAAETTEQQEAKKQSKFQRRLDRQKTARVAAETEARLLRERNAQLEAQLKPQPSKDDGAEPKREDFPDYETYLRAVAKYDAAQETSKTLKAERDERSRREEASRATATQDQVAKDWSEREKAFQAATKDYIEVVTPYVEEDLSSLSDGARRAIVESEVGPQVLHHLATHPDEHERISELSPVRQVAELGKLEAKMAPAPKKTATASNAPAPITTTKGGRSAPNGYSENMTDAEYREWRKSQGARWAR
jgi:hypothetical protein